MAVLRRATRGAAALLALSVLACGCRAANTVRTKAVRDNVDLAAASNELLLLNVLRAKDRVPMFFTSPTGPTDTIGVESGLESEIPIGPKSGSSYGAKVGVSGSASRTLETGILDSDEFWKGVTTPVTASTFEYYWSQGWQRELLMLLCVQKIVKSTKDDSGVVTESPPYQNYIGGPGRHDQFIGFRAIVRQLLDAGAEWSSKPDVRWVGPAFAPKDVSIEQIAAAKEQGLLLLPCPGTGLEKELCPTGGLWRLAKKDLAYYFKFPAQTDSRAKSLGEARAYTQDAPRSPQGTPAAALEGKSEVSYDLTMRSPEAILYYLGEIVRAQEDDGFVASIAVRSPNGTTRGEEAAIFMLRCGVPGDDCPGLGVDYCGRRYGVPCDGSEGRTKQTLSLVAQFLALTKSAKDLPSTNVVQLIGR
ncbi:MAG: hypothetical protein U1E39_12705 [Planctomycetota bacterium]